ncbi:PTS ascorbate transporter subunit IIC [Actinomyces sp. 2119]|uniref:Ascorbate-specific PTS system EIIC component n=1 Tax=Actinomyces lilanjuaniae TaxID=2321394 RepID=A0ABM6Z241_9ACTO|nr:MULTISPECIES: PTS ascorbate transporter subunit IIC [Actinomyces]AYD89046.1 PTS ascorbate transporter subunit IIC [Actinomyces lilanjuaniae]RJF40512.1 PTS ascorbate transporter subunit IIC [Actinomyces sp. 2119]RJF41827.1 PTS ascorbate transporter subunit IIC [Actinomyces sp. 2119]
MSALGWVISNILTQAGIVIALIAMLGLVLQGKGVGATVVGTFKTLLGFYVLAAGSAILVDTLTYFGTVFQAAFNMTGVVPSIEAVNGYATNNLQLGGQIALTFLGIFVVNILLARLTPWKYIFLTGQALLWMATMTVVLGHAAGLHGAWLIAAASLVGGVFAVGMPAAAQPIVRRITGNDAIALGHFCTIGYLVEAGVAWLVRRRGTDRQPSTEEVTLPRSLEFLQDTYMSLAVVMVPLYLVTAAFAGADPVADQTGDMNHMVHAFIQAVQFVVGVYVLMAGVRLLLGEIVPAFRGISMRLVPDSRPALDCPVLFPYAPNAVVVGFITTTLGTVIAMLALPALGFAVIVPGMLTNFFAGGTAGIFGNAVGGRRGALVGGVVHGLFITLLPALLVTTFLNLGFPNLSATDVDTITAGLVFAYVIGPIMRAF